MSRPESQPSKAAGLALSEVLESLQDLSPDDRKRVLHAATAFYRVEQNR